MTRELSVRERVVQLLSSPRAKKAITIGPPLVWVVLLILAPLAFLVTVSFASIDDAYNIIWVFSIDNYVALFQAEGLQFWQTPFVRAFGMSLFVAITTTVVTLLLALPVAYFLARCSGRVFKITFYLVILPFFTVYLVRVYSWYLVFGDSGAINVLLQTIGVTNQSIGALDYGWLAIIVALVHAFLPYMLFTLYASFDGFDFSLIDAARDLGANRRETFTDIVVPRILPGMIGGSVFVFAPSLGAFVAPQILGQGKVQMIGQLMGMRINSLYAIGYGSAVSLFIIIPTVIAFVVGFKYAAFDIGGGGA